MTFLPIKHWTKLLLRPDYKKSYAQTKELQRIKNTPRYTNISTNLLGPKLLLPDGLSFYYSYKEIFAGKIYSFKTTKPAPRIIDGGSNIGLSIIYLKDLYPNSKIIGFEADPKVFQLLKSNIASFELDNVTLINKALWSSECLIEFAEEGADGGRVARNGEFGKNRKVKLKTVRLRDYLDQPIDFLKLDVEGAELEILSDCSYSLNNVENIFVEYHSFKEEEQRLDELLHILRASRFRFQILTQFSSPNPFLTQPTQLGMDLQLNIFGYRQ